jgi:RNA polymerase sigma-70 factor (ECF subfamily)
MTAASQPNSYDRFAATRWSLVASAASSDDASARRALIELCLRYWYPVYAYVRGCGHEPATARDMTRAYFEHLIGNRSPGELQGSGRFREHLLIVLHQFLARDWRSAGNAPVPEFEHADDGLEERYRADAREALGPEQVYQRSYALQVLNSALERLRGEAQQAGRIEMFETLLPFLSEEPVPGQLAHLAARLRVAPLALVMSLKRLRQRFRELAHAELAQTVSSAADLDQERVALAKILEQP